MFLWIVYIDYILKVPLRLHHGLCVENKIIYIITLSTQHIPAVATEFVFSTFFLVSKNSNRYAVNFRVPKKYREASIILRLSLTFKPLSLLPRSGSQNQPLASALFQQSARISMDPRAFKKSVCALLGFEGESIVECGHHISHPLFAWQKLLTALYRRDIKHINKFKMFVDRASGVERLNLGSTTSHRGC